MHSELEGELTVLLGKSQGDITGEWIIVNIDSCTIGGADRRPWLDDGETYKCRRGWKDSLLQLFPFLDTRHNFHAIMPCFPRDCASPAGAAAGCWACSCGVALPFQFVLLSVCWVGQKLSCEAIHENMRTSCTCIDMNMEKGQVAAHLFHDGKGFGPCGHAIASGGL